jgi:cysteine desulfurase/selenocysteine lyase
LVSFNVGSVHAHDVATIFDREGVAVRAGHHCCMPLLEKLGVPATVRASFYLYNSEADVDRLMLALDQVERVFGRRDTRGRAAA